MKVIILAGGSGTRLWPLSRTNYPKQFLKLGNMDKSFFQMSFQRSLKLTDINQIFIVANRDYNFLVLRQIEELGYKFNKNQVLLEPIGKNTLPAIYYGVKEIQKQGEDIVVVFPSDHLIKNEDVLIETIKKGAELTNKFIVTLGVHPFKPHTGYGYIKPKEPLTIGYRVDRFKEKPDYQSAQTYLRDGYLWNCGMFMFRTDVFCDEIQKHSLDVYQSFKLNDIEDIYMATPSISIDYGLVEKSQRVAVIPISLEWTDLGSFDAFYNELNGDENGNISFKNNILIDSGNNLLFTEKEKAVALIGVDNLIIADQRDALLICKKDHSQRVKDVVNKLKLINDLRVDFHYTTYRPWGSCTLLGDQLFYKIKHLSVLPGKKLDNHMHRHRSKYWIVVNGTAKVSLDDMEVDLRSRESIFIKSGLKHSLENPGKDILEVIEVQLGDCLEEDDTVRFSDDVGRWTRV